MKRQHLNADEEWTVAKTGMPDFSKIQDAVRYCTWEVRTNGYRVKILVGDGDWDEVVSLAGGNPLFINGNVSNRRAVNIKGLSVRDNAICLINGLSMEWMLGAQNGTIDAENIAFLERISGYQITMDESRLNIGSYEIAGAAPAHEYAGFGGIIDIGSGTTYVNGGHVTGKQFDISNRGMLIRAGNAIPGTVSGTVGDGLLIG